MVVGPAGGAGAPIVYVVDDDDAIRRSLSNLLLSVGLRVQSFGSTGEFRAAQLANAPSCLLLDVRLRGESGLAFQQQVSERPDIPIIFITGFADVDICKRAMKGGAVDFLVKPFADQDVIDAVNGALAADQKRREKVQAQAVLTRAYEQLTRREREVLAFVVSGALNKQIAGWLGVTVITVKLHRAAVMRKMDASSLADLVRKSEALGIEAPAVPQN
ncbi:response regulator transcription factor [Paraburkholderia youngii]|uniref:Response regulator transcription factor n=1 Tax=Paraburkholderia youngii TaxID=2782701 RepID=A0A7Y6MY01_9BURK|nr:response regulator [Paraburkholderia youngii]NUY01443.1 response regulator transcription factor [Paraburkholderia youngii]